MAKAPKPGGVVIPAGYGLFDISFEEDPETEKNSVVQHAVNKVMRFKPKHTIEKDRICMRNIGKGKICRAIPVDRLLQTKEGNLCGWGD